MVSHDPRLGIGARGTHGEQTAGAQLPHDLQQHITLVQATCPSRFRGGQSFNGGYVPGPRDAGSLSIGFLSALPRYRHGGIRLDGTTG